MKLSFQRHLQNFLWTLRTCSRYLEGPRNIALCVSKKFVTVQHTNKKILTKTLKKILSTWNFEYHISFALQNSMKLLKKVASKQSLERWHQQLVYAKVEKFYGFVLSFNITLYCWGTAGSFHNVLIFTKMYRVSLHSFSEIV